MKPADFLPSFFKHAKRVIPGQGEVDDAAKNFLTPSSTQEPVPAIVAAIPDKPKIDIPFKVPALPPGRSIDPNLALPSDALPAYTGATVEPSGAAISSGVARDMGHVTMSKRGRPQPLPGELDPSSTEKTLAVNKAYQNYDPAANPSKGWRKWVPTMISGALRGFAAGGPGGALFGAAEGGIGGAMDPSRANREWQRKKLGEIGPVVGGIRNEQAEQVKNARELAGLEGTLASTALAKKRTEDLDKPKSGQVHQDENGGWISIDPVTKTTAPILDPLTKKQAMGKSTGAKEEWVHDGQGNAHKYRDGKDTGLIDPGRKLVMEPGYGPMTPGSKYTADQMARRETESATERATIASGKAQAARSESETLRNSASIHLTNADDIEGRLQQLDPEDEGAAQEIAAGRAEVARLRTEARAANDQANKLKNDAMAFESEVKAASGRAKGRKYKVDPKFLQ